MAIGKLGFVVALPLLAALASEASACTVAPFVETWANQGTVAWVGTDSDCRLETTLAASSDGTAASVAHYRRPYPSEPFRISFRVGLPSGLSLNIIQSAQLLRGVARSAPAAGQYQARMLGISLGGNVTGTKFVPSIFAACTTNISGTCALAGPPLDAADFPMRVTVELMIGAGPAGSLKYWLGDDVSGSPTGILGDLDNAAWSGIERITLGLGDSTAGFRQLLAGRPIVLDQIVAYDDGMFWSDFDSSDILDLVPNAAPITGSNVSMQGSTCTGTNLLSQVASGSTSLYGPVAIHAIPAANQNVRQIQVQTPSQSGTAIFLCGAGLGPASACTSALSSGSSWGPLLVMPSLEERTLVVGKVGFNDATCYPYSLTVTGTLGANEE